jgi:hypothetical protein
MEQTELTMTQQYLMEMMCQDVGSGLLGREDFYKQAWVRNRMRDLSSEPAARLYKDGRSNEDGSIRAGVSVSMFHFLAKRLTFQKEMTEAISAWGDLEENRYIYLSEEGKRWLDEAGIDYAVVFSDATSNHSTFLDGDFLIDVIRLENDFPAYGIYEDEIIIFLQVHNGVDLRGGYARVAAFLPSDEWENLLNWNRARVVCENGHAFDLDGRHAYLTGPGIDDETMREFRVIMREDDRAGCSICGQPLQVFA